MSDISIVAVDEAPHEEDAPIASTSAVTLDQHDLESSETSNKAKRPRTERNRQQLSCADCHNRKQKCDRNIPCGRCVARKVGHLCHVKDATNKRTARESPTKRRKQAEIAADNERELLLHNARSVVDKAARGDTEALGQLTRIFAKADADVSYVGSANVHSFLAVSGAGSVPPTPGGANPPLTSDAPDILSQFPARGVVDHLIDIFTASGPLDHFPFAPIALQRAYLNFAKVLDMRNQVADGIYLLHDSASLSPVSHAFICLVAMSCVLALQALPSDAITFVEVYGDLLEMRRHFYALARAALTRSDIEETPDMTRIEAIVMMGLYLKNEGRPSDNFLMHAQAIRCAQAIGLHREGGQQWGLDVHEQELRRRMWWSLYSYDRMSSFSLGRPPVVHDAHCDVALPANRDLADITKPPRPLSEVTTATMLIIQCRLGKVVGHLFDRAFSTQTPTYSVILDLDQELQTFENELPPAFRNPTMDDKLSLPRLEFQQRMVTVQVCWIRSILHRRYLLKPYPKEGQEDRYARSRKIATMLSRTVINVVREILEESPPHIRGNFLWSSQLFSAACNLAVALKALPATTANQSEARKLDDQILLARSLLSSLSASNRTATSAISMIDFLRSRYAPPWHLPELEQLTDPLIHTSLPLPSAQASSNGSSSPEDPLAFLSTPIDAHSWHAQADMQLDDTWTNAGVFEIGTNEWQKTLDALLRMTPPPCT